MYPTGSPVPKCSERDVKVQQSSGFPIISVMSRVEALFLIDDVRESFGNIAKSITGYTPLV